MNNNKVSTSVQYEFTNKYLFDAVVKGWANFNQHLTKGDRFMKTMLCNEWDRLKDELMKNSTLELKDAERIVGYDDFGVTINYTDNGSIVFFFRFPNFDFSDGASRYVALALTSDIPRYFTLEYSENPNTHDREYVVGELLLNGNKKEHKSYGVVDNDRLSYFAGYVMNILNISSK